MSAGLQMLGMNAAFDALESFADEMTDDEAYVGTTAEYASFLEFGTVNMKPRPFMKPSIRKGMKPNMIQDVLDGVLSGEVDNKALQIAFEIRDIAKKGIGHHDPPAPPGEYPAQPTGNLAGSIAAAAEETEMRSKSEAGKKE